MSVPLLLLAFLTLTSANGYSKYEKRDYSLVQPYQTSGWHFYGSTLIEPDHVRLTQDIRSQVGGLHCTVPVIFRDWEVHLTFHVHGTGTNLFGDGFALWYTETPASSGTAFGSREVFRGLGLFFDTYANQNGAHNHDHPYISAMVGDGTKVYDHDRDGTHTELAGCSSDFRNREKAVAVLRYVREQLSLFIQYPGVEKEIQCFTVDNVRLPVGYYFGISAATGDLSDSHDLHSIRTYEVDANRLPSELTEEISMIEPSVGKSASPRAHVVDPPFVPPKRHWLSVVWWLFVLGCLVGGAYFGYTYYNRRQRQMKRLF